MNLSLNGLTKRLERIEQALPEPVRPIDFDPEDRAIIEEIYAQVGYREGEPVRDFMRRCSDEQLDILHSILERYAKRA